MRFDGQPPVRSLRCATLRPHPSPLPLLVVLLSSCAHVPEVTPGRAWTSPLHRSHPLVGRIWDVRAGTAIDARELADRLASADDVLLGEIHDNADHHLLQAELVRAITSRGRRPVLAFEMIPSLKQAQVDAALARASTPESLAAGVEWSKSGWPDFAIYRPVVAAGLEVGLPIVAADLSKGEAKAVAFQGLASLPKDEAQALEADVLPASIEREWAAEMADSHCGVLPESALAPMVLAQRARDLRLARRLLETGKERGTILIAGGGHVRTDRAVPAWIARLAPGRKVVSVGLREVSGDLAGTFPAERPPFDYVIFTPGHDRGDPCEELRKRHAPKTSSVPT